MKIYIRRKEPGKGWRCRAVPKVGGRPVAEAGVKFHVRYPDADDKFVWSQGYDSFEEAEKAAAWLELNAIAVGLTIEEYKDKANSQRTPIKVAIERFASDARKTKKQTTADHDQRRLKAFEESLPRGVRFMDEANRDVPLGFRDYLASKGKRGNGHAAQTLPNHLMTVFALLKKNRIAHGLSLSDGLREPEEDVGG